MVMCLNGYTVYKETTFQFGTVGMNLAVRTIELTNGYIYTKIVDFVQEQKI